MQLDFSLTENCHSCLHNGNCIICSMISVSCFFIRLLHNYFAHMDAKLKVKSLDASGTCHCFITQVLNHVFTASYAQVKILSKVVCHHLDCSCVTYTMGLSQPELSGRLGPKLSCV